jgi:hypothetical protein
MTLDELDKTTSFSRRDLDISDLTKSLEERAQLILGDIAGEATDKDSGVIGISELIHRLWSTIVAHRWSAHRVHAHGSWSMHTTAHGTGNRTAAIFRSCGANAHRSITTVYTLHLRKRTLLFIAIRESNEAVASRHSSKRISHDFGRLARWVTVSEDAEQNALVNIWSEISNKDAEFWSAFFTASVSQTATRGPVELEWTGGVWNDLTIESKSFSGSLRSLKIDEAVSGIITIVIVRGK